MEERLLSPKSPALFVRDCIQSFRLESCSVKNQNVCHSRKEQGGGGEASSIRRDEGSVENIGKSACRGILRYTIGTGGCQTLLLGVGPPFNRCAPYVMIGGMYDDIE